jgi:hypothetical protein
MTAVSPITHDLQRLAKEHLGFEHPGTGVPITAI